MTRRAAAGRTGGTVERFRFFIARTGYGTREIVKDLPIKDDACGNPWNRNLNPIGLADKNTAVGGCPHPNDAGHTKLADTLKATFNAI